MRHTRARRRHRADSAAGGGAADTAEANLVCTVDEGGPADKDWVKVKVGDYLLAIDGKQVKAGDEYWQLLNNRLNRKVTAKFNRTAAGGGTANTRHDARHG